MKDFEKAYQSEEYKAFLEQAGNTDITPMMFEDSEDKKKTESFGNGCLGFTIAKKSEALIDTF